MYKRWHKQNIQFNNALKNIKGFTKLEINGKLTLGVLSIKKLSKLTGFKNLLTNKKING